MGRFRFVLTMVFFVAGTASARAGVYCSLDQLPYPVPTTFGKVFNKLVDLHSVMNTEQIKGNKLQEAYFTRIAQLEVKKRDQGLSIEEYIDLSGLYLRVRRFGNVVELLKNADQTHFLVLAHLAAANFGLAELDPPRAYRYLDQAVYYQEKALAAWPEVSLRWSAAQLAWYRRAERYYLELLRLRQQEVKQGNTVWQNVDALFPRLRLATADGGYEVGGPSSKQAERMQEDVPADALPLVGQLVWWLPTDNRLYWLYAEVLNYRGDYVAAAKVFEELGGFNSTRKLSTKAFRDHYQAFTKAGMVWRNRLKIAYLLTPRSGQLEGCAAPLTEAGYMAALEMGEKLDDPNEQNAKEFLFKFQRLDLPPDESGPQGTSVPPSSVPTASWLPDWPTVVVSFTAGMIFMALVLLQWREWTRRRSLTEPSRQQQFTG